MASVIRDPDGRKRIQWLDGSAARRTFRLGKCDVKQAESFALRIENLITANITGRMDQDLAKWVDSRDDKTHEKLARAGLIPSRERVNPTLAKLLDAYFETLNVKEGTATTYRQTRASLEKHFGAARLLATITPLECDRWRQAMRDEGLADATVAKRVKTARQFFRQGIKWRMLTENPLTDVKAGGQTNRDRMAFIPRADADKVLAACPDPEWRLLFALSRYGGLRCPSEHLGLRWQDIDWERGRITVRSPKTEGHEGREFRVLPLFPELKPHLLEVFEAAEPGAEHVITKYRDPGVNLRTQFQRIITRAGVKPWPKLFHNLRATRQTELAESYPIHVVCAWLGNTQAVAQNHYLQVVDAHFEKGAAQSGAESGALAAQNAAQRPPASNRTDSQTESQVLMACGPVPKSATPCDCSQGVEVTPRGFEPLFSG